MYGRSSLRPVALQEVREQLVEGVAVFDHDPMPAPAEDMQLRPPELLEEIKARLEGDYDVVAAVNQEGLVLEALDGRVVKREGVDGPLARRSLACDREHRGEAAADLLTGRRAVAVVRYRLEVAAAHVGVVDEPSDNLRHPLGRRVVVEAPEVVELPGDPERHAHRAH